MIISVPATSANLGPGFDCLGIAWNCFNNVEFILSDETEISGCPEQYCGLDNLCYRAFIETLSYKGRYPLPVKIVFRECEIPIARGFGSSAALIVCGIRGADELYDLHLTKDEILQIATKLESHPDNLAPAILGGFTAATVCDNVVSAVSFPVNKDWAFTAFIPDYELSTALARSVLPDSYSRADAVQNIGCTAMLIKALETCDHELIKQALHDTIHEPYRKGLIPEFDVVEQIVKTCGGDGMCISGAGSTMLCFSDADAQKKIIEEGRERFPEWTIRKMEVFYIEAG